MQATRKNSLYYLKITNRLSKWYRDKLRATEWQWSDELKCYYNATDPESPGIEWAERAIVKFGGKMSTDNTFKTIHTIKRM